MKKVLIVCLIALVFMFISCNKQRDSYYVKYEVSAYKSIAGRWYPADVHIEMLNTDTIVVKSANGEFTETYGPYKYKDLTYLKINGNCKLEGKIYVSKNESPFVLKEEIHTSGEISYIINF